MGHSPRFALPHRTILAAAALSAALSAGCATLPVTGVKATGEPLLADIRTEQHQFVSQVKTGEVVNKDADGRVIGTSEVYEDQLMSYNVTRWESFQGSAKIDDQDFFRIGGDLQAADEIALTRARGVATNRAGWVVLGVGVAALAGGLALGSATRTRDPISMEEKSGTAGTIMAGVGVLGALIGGGLAAWGNAVARQEHPINDPRRAKRVERTYNKRLGVQPAPPAAAAPPQAGAPAPRRRPVGGYTGPASLPPGEE